MAVLRPRGVKYENIRDLFHIGRSCHLELNPLIGRHSSSFHRIYFALLLIRSALHVKATMISDRLRQLYSFVDKERKSIDDLRRRGSRVLREAEFEFFLMRFGMRIVTAFCAQ